MLTSHVDEAECSISTQGWNQTKIILHFSFITFVAFSTDITIPMYDPNLHSHVFVTYFFSFFTLYSISSWPVFQYLFLLCFPFLLLLSLLLS